jgi:hypothetical protein
MEEHRVEEEEDPDIIGGMYGGLSDDWEEYIDMLNYN